MRAAVFHRSGERLALEEVERPVPGEGEIALAVSACGFCHTDLHYLDHGVPTAHPPPLILGHEISGRVEELGPHVDGWAPGARAILPAVLPCGRCRNCRSGRENLCERLEMFGNHRDGGFAEFVIAPAKDVIPLPDDIDLVNASIIADALSTPYHAVVNRARVRPGEWVVVVGCGGVGINAVQFARASGGRVIAVDLSEDRLAVARRLGAAVTFNPAKNPEAGKEIRRLTGGGADVAIEAVGRPATIELAFTTLGRGGRLCLVGYSSEPAQLPAAKTMFFEYEIRGSLGCRPVDYPKVIEMVRRGEVQLGEIVSARVALEDVNEAADRLRRSEGLRTVVVP